MVSVAVEVLHLPLVEGCPLDVLFCAELMVDERQRSDIPHAALDVRAFVAGGEMVDVEDAAQVVSDLDEHAFAQARRLYR
jgi:hypothetical protein